MVKPPETIKPNNISTISAKIEPLSKKFRLLFVDDNAINRKLGQRLCEKLGAEVVVADGGLSAIQTYHNNNNQFDIMFVSIFLIILLLFYYFYCFITSYIYFLILFIP